MQRLLFEKFYTGTVEVIAQDLIQDNKDFQYRKNLDGVYEEYLNQRTALRYLIKNHSIESNGDNASNSCNNNSILLDGHKVAACMTCAIIKARLITTSSIDDHKSNMYTLEKSNRLNEQLAALSGLSCLLSYMIEDKENLRVVSQPDEGLDLFFPETKYPERSTYLSSFIRGLYYSNLISTINPLMLSNIFFMIEQYHRKCVEFKNYKASHPDHTE